LRQTRDETPALRGAIGHVLPAYVRGGRKDLVLWKVLQHGAWLRRHTEGWAGVLQALVSANLSTIAILWSADYARRENLEPWMLYNRTVALRKRLLSAFAQPVYEHALRLTADSATVYHRAFMAYELALRGETDEAAAHFQRVPNDLGLNVDFIVTVTDCLLLFQRASEADRDGTFFEIKARIDGLKVSMWSQEAHLRRRTRRALARMRGTASAYLWAYPVRVAIIVAVLILLCLQ
jgi:hypothetical protein